MQIADEERTDTLNAIAAAHLFCHSLSFYRLDLCVWVSLSFTTDIKHIICNENYVNITV